MATKRTFEESNLAEEFKNDVDESKEKKKETRFKEKHSLDSDEEDNAENYNLMEEDDIEGQEDATIDYDEGIQITPFNMKEELEEGHFDSDGMYIFKKDKNEIRDGWMDNIDWVRVKESEKEKENDSGSDDGEQGLTNVDEICHYRKMLQIMKEGETVTKCLCRLGGGKKNMSASQRWKNKKQKVAQPEQTEEEKQEAAKNEQDLLLITGLADELLGSGNMEIYQATYEKLAFKVKEADEAEEKKKKAAGDADANDFAADMFGDDDDDNDDTNDNNKEKSESDDESKTASKDDTSKSELKSAGSLSDEVMWEYKWEDKDDAEIHGPYTSSQMLEWQEEDFFEDGVFCRKVGSNTDFYTSKRIDFEIYT